MSETSAEALTPYGWSERVIALFDDSSTMSDPSVQPARVVRVERASCAAAMPDGTEQWLNAPHLPAVGDWIVVGQGSVIEVMPRWSALSRVDPSGDSIQVLAANMDVVMITAPADRLSPARVERELAVAWDSGAEPLVAVTKVDLGSEQAVSDLAHRLVGVDVIATSSATFVGIDELRERIRPARTAVLLGPSGAGKSTLANALIGADLLATGAVREGDSRGRHTTTWRQLVPVPGGGVLIDTPGLRSLSLGAEVDVGVAFPDIGALAEGCRFGDCGHQVEPGCAVIAAVAASSLDPGRLASFHKLQREIVREQSRTDPLLRKAMASTWKARTRSARHHDKRR